MPDLSPRRPARPSTHALPFRESIRRSTPAFPPEGSSRTTPLTCRFHGWKIPLLHLCYAICFVLGSTLVAACAHRSGADGACGPGERSINGKCLKYQPVCAELKGKYLTYPSPEEATTAGASRIADGECCASAADCDRRGRWDQRCVAKSDPNEYRLELREDWFACLTGKNDVRCQCGGPNGAPVCQFTTSENPKFMACYGQHLPNPPPAVAAPENEEKEEPGDDRPVNP